MNNYFDIGYPAHYGSCHIGLYQPVLKRFLLTVCNIQQAREIVMIVGGRYSLYPVDLVTASNYCKNLIDNDCCENWRLPESQTVAITRNTYVDYYIEAKILIPQQEYFLDIDIDNEKKYLQMVWYYVKLFEQLYMKNVYAWRVKQFMIDIFDHQDPQYEIVQDIKKQIVKELFYSKDINATQTALDNIIANAKKKHDIIL
jgi:hypothetical protein